MTDREFIMQMRPWIGSEEKKAINSYMEEDGFLTEFKNTKKFEEAIAEFTGSRHCIAVNNGTISLTLAALALGIKPGDEVLVPNFTMVATPNSIKMIGAQPIFIDVEPDTLCIDLDEIKRNLTPKTKAIMLVSANGRHPKTDISEYLNFARENNLEIIEDAAQSLGSYFEKDSHIGLQGAIGSFSFSMPKIITTGQGGALVTNNEELAHSLRKLKDFGRTAGGSDIHDSIGYNSKFTEMQAVIGLEQIKKLDFRMERKKEIWKRYKVNLQTTKKISLFDHNLDLTTPWFIDSLCEDRENLSRFLKECSIGTRVMYPPLNKQECYNVDGNFPISCDVGERGLWLPSYTQLSNEDIDYISERIIEFYS
jgi:perosamine synthetase